MKKILLMVLIAMGLNAHGQDTTINKMEYFLDTDPGFGKGISIPVSPSPNLTQSYDVDISGYNPGYHIFYLRTRDNLGRWSLTARRNIEVLPGTPNPIEIGEYFIDTDPGYGKGKTISITKIGEEILETFAASISSLPIGYHLLYGRVRDKNGNWSQTFRRNIEVINATPKLVVEGEYFFKTDNGFGKCSPVKFAVPAAEGNFAFNIPVAQIPADVDTIFVRVRQDGQNIWSLTRWSVVNTALPLTWLDFTVLRKENIVALNWQTTNEINTTLFNVQRSTDAVHFTNIGIVLTTNRAGVNNYFFNDPIESISAKKVFYRLQQMDINGDARLSKIVSVELDGGSNLISFYPNPVTDHLTVFAENPSDLLGATLTVTDLSGKTLFKQKLTTSRQQSVNLSALARGMYFIQINKQSGMDVYKIMKE